MPNLKTGLNYDTYLSMSLAFKTYRDLPGPIFGKVKCMWAFAPDVAPRRIYISRRTLLCLI